MICLAAFLFLTVRVHSSSVTNENPGRSAKIMRFSVDRHDVYSDVLDDLHDPLPSADEIGKKNESDFRVDQVKFRLRNGTKGVVKSGGKQVGTEEKLVESSLHRLEADNPGVTHYDKQGYMNHEPVGNKTKEIKVFWNSVTDAIESIPFIPVQVNVPDMISAMANFLTSSIPIINRFTNPNNPRLPNLKESNEIDNDFIDGVHHNWIYDGAIEDRELKSDYIIIDSLTRKRNKQQRRRGSNSKQKSSSKGIINRPLFQRTTEAPTMGTKTLPGLGFLKPQSVKNMPITRKRFHLVDREVFNFKNSDITNSPIMILNIPSRPMVYYKSKMNQKVDGEKKDSVNHKFPEMVATGVVNETSKAARARPKRRESPRKASKRVRNVQKQKRDEGNATKNKSN